MRHRRSRLGAGLDQAGAADEEDRQARRRHRLGPGRSRLRPATRPRRPRGACLREERPARRLAALWHPRLQARKAAHRAPRRADEGGRRRVPLQDPRRQGRHRRLAAGELRRGRARRRRRAGARPAGARARSLRRLFRDGVPAAAEPPRLRRADRHQRADPGGWQACRRHRRRRHRLGLHRHLDPPGRAEGDPARNHADAAQSRGQDAELAELAGEAAHLVQPRGRRRARFRRDDAAGSRARTAPSPASNACGSTTR